jgi:hypothetical protein
VDRDCEEFFPDRPELDFEIESKLAFLKLIHLGTAYEAQFAIIRIGQKKPKGSRTVRKCRVHLLLQDDIRSVIPLDFLSLEARVPIHLSATTNLSDPESVIAEIRQNLLERETDIRPIVNRGFAVALGLETDRKVFFLTRNLKQIPLVTPESPSKLMPFKVWAEAENADYTPSEWYVLEVGHAWNDFHVRRLNDLSKAEKARVQWEWE